MKLTLNNTQTAIKKLLGFFNQDGTLKSTLSATQILALIKLCNETSANLQKLRVVEKYKNILDRIDLCENFIKTARQSAEAAQKNEEQKNQATLEKYITAINDILVTDAILFRKEQELEKAISEKKTLKREGSQKEATKIKAPPKDIIEEKKKVDSVAIQTERLKNIIQALPGAILLIPPQAGNNPLPPLVYIPNPEQALNNININDMREFAQTNPLILTENGFVVFKPLPTIRVISERPVIRCLQIPTDKEFEIKGYNRTFKLNELIELLKNAPSETRNAIYTHDLIEQLRNAENIFEIDKLIDKEVNSVIGDLSTKQRRMLLNDTLPKKPEFEATNTRSPYEKPTGFWNNEFPRPTNELTTEKKNEEKEENVISKKSNPLSGPQ